MTGTDYRSRLIAAREALGLTRHEMAARLLTARQTYEQWETGARRTPGIAVVAAEALMSSRPKKPRGPRKLSRPRPGTLTGRVYDCADGTRTASEIAGALGVPKRAVHQAIAWIRRRGWPIDVPQAPRGPRPRKNAARDEEIAAALRAGESYRSIADRYGMSYENVRRIGVQMGVVVPGEREAQRRAAARLYRETAQRLREERAAARAAERQRIEDAMIAAVQAGTSIRRAAAELGLTASQAHLLSRRLGLGALTRHGRWRSVKTQEGDRT
jgi:DNA-binding XRE family transcriptional regulator